MKITQNRQLKSLTTMEFPVFPGCKIVAYRNYRHVSNSKSIPFWGIVQVEFTFAGVTKIYQKLNWNTPSKADFIKQLRAYFQTVTEQSLQDGYAKFMFDNSPTKLILLMDEANTLRQELEKIRQYNEKNHADYLAEVKKANEGKRTKSVVQGSRGVYEDVFVRMSKMSGGMGDDPVDYPVYEKQYKVVPNYVQVADYPKEPEKRYDKEKANRLYEVEKQIAVIKKAIEVSTGSI